MHRGEIGIPMIDDYRSESAISSSDIFVISGKAQTYKTTLAVDIMQKLLDASPGSTAIWVDCDFKFPFDCIKDKGVDGSKLKIVRCKCSEEILFCLQKIHYLAQSDSSINTVVIDGITASYWIDQVSKSVSTSKKPKLFIQMKQMIDNLVAELGLKVIVTLHYLGDFQIWNSSPYCSTQFIECRCKEPGKGFIISGEMCEKFKIKEGRKFEWGKRSLAKHELEFKNEENEADAEEIVI